MEENNLPVFKSYLRQLIVRLKELKKALEADDKDRALEIVDQLILDTQAGIEDN